MPGDGDQGEEPEVVQSEETVGQRVRALRLERGWSLRVLAAQAGVSHQYIDFLEKGQRQRLDLEMVKKLARALGVEIDKLLGEKWVGSRQAAYAENEDLEEIQVNLLTLSELDPRALASLREIVLAMTEKAEREYLEERRAKRRRHGAVGQAGQADKEV